MIKGSLRPEIWDEATPPEEKRSACLGVPTCRALGVNDYLDRQVPLVSPIRPVSTCECRIWSRLSSGTDTDWTPKVPNMIAQELEKGPKMGLISNAFGVQVQCKQPKRHKQTRHQVGYAADCTLGTICLLNTWCHLLGPTPSHRGKQ